MLDELCQRVCDGVLHAFLMPRKASPDFPVTDADWERCAAKIDTSNGEPGVDDCWLWNGRVTVNPNHPRTGGYPLTTFRVAGQQRLVHRLAWIYFRGALGPELSIDHLCHAAAEPPCPPGPCAHRRCINPWHMDPCPADVNARRSEYFSQEKTHCIRGHEMTGRRTTTGEQYCRECIRLSTQRWRANKRDAVA